jgi:hypothetical protein
MFTSAAFLACAVFVLAAAVATAFIGRARKEAAMALAAQEAKDLERQQAIEREAQESRQRGDRERLAREAQERAEVERRKREREAAEAARQETERRDREARAERLRREFDLMPSQTQAEIRAARALLATVPIDQLPRDFHDEAHVATIGRYLEYFDIPLSAVRAAVGRSGDMKSAQEHIKNLGLRGPEEIEQVRLAFGLATFRDCMDAQIFSKIIKENGGTIRSDWDDVKRFIRLHRSMFPGF